jgi:hypothetical protein
MSDDAMSDDEMPLGPVDYLVVEFPGNRMTGEALPMLLDLVDQGIIRVLDLAFVRKDADGSVSGISVTDLDSDGAADVGIFDDAASGLLDDEDLADAASVLEPGNAAGIVVYENTWAAPFAAALRRSGAQLVASGRIPMPALLAAATAVDGS